MVYCSAMYFAIIELKSKKYCMYFLFLSIPIDRKNVYSGK